MLLQTTTQSESPRASLGIVFLPALSQTPLVENLCSYYFVDLEFEELRD